MAAAHAGPQAKPTAAVCGGEETLPAAKLEHDVPPCVGPKDQRGA
jgi:hypothetical protein